LKNNYENVKGIYDLPIETGLGKDSKI